MRYGCLASLAFYAIVVTLLIPNGVIPVLLILGIVLLYVVRWIGSERPLY